jgi:PKD repeat protein
MLIIFSSANISVGDENNKVYGFIIEVTSDQTYSMQANITRLINNILHENYSVYWITEDYKIKTQRITLDNNEKSHSKNFKKGSFITPVSTNSLDNKKIASLVYLDGIGSKVNAYAIKESLKNIKVLKLNEPKILHYEAKGVDGYSYRRLLRQGGFYQQEILEADDLLINLTNNNYNLVTIGGGSGVIIDMYHDTLTSTGLKVTKKIREFVRNGGGYIGSCYGAHRAASGTKRPIGYPKIPEFNFYMNFLPIQMRIVDNPVYRALPGAGDITIKLENSNHPVTFGLPQIIRNHNYLAGPMFLEKTVGESNTVNIASIQEIERENWSWNSLMDYCFWWKSDLVPDEVKTSLAEKWIEKSIGKTIWVAGEFENGKLVAFGGHPEYTDVNDDHMRWGEPPRIVYNSVFYVTADKSSTVNIEKSFSFSILDVNTGGPYTTLEDNSVYFKGSVNSGKSPYSWYWVFDRRYDYYNIDMEYENRQNASNYYEYYGDYKACLRVIDANGDFGCNCTTIKVFPEYYDFQILIDVPFDGYVGEEIDFRCKIENSYRQYNYSWNFGDGNTSNEKYTEHIYEAPGRYEYSITAENEYGYSETSYESIYISPAPTVESYSKNYSGILLFTIIFLIIIIFILIIIIIKIRKS